MNKQPSSTIMTRLCWGIFFLALLFLAFQVIPRALGQRDAAKPKATVNLAAAGRQGGEPASLVGASQAMPGGVLTPNLSPWTIVADYPLVSESVAVASDGTFAYAVGGLGGGSPTNSFNRYDPVANTWTPLPNIPTGFYDAPAVYAANTNSIYVFGGLDTNFIVRNITQIYNIGTGTWTTGAPMPDANGRYFASGAYYPGNGKIYVIGGFDGATFSEQSQTWEYDPVANTWNTSRASIPVPMGGAGFSIVGQYIYLAGHWNNGAASTDHYRYDIVGDSWASMAPVPVPIYRPDAAGVGTNTYLVGGGNPYLSSGVKGQARKLASMRAPAISYTATYIYDTVANSWTTGPNTNVAHSFTGGTAIGNLLMVVTGYDGFGDTNTVEMADAGGGGGIVLDARVRRQGGNRFVVLNWSPADGGDINVLRNGAVRGTTDDDGSFQINIHAHTGTDTYQVCETDTGVCSNVVTVTTH